MKIRQIIKYFCVSLCFCIVFTLCMSQEVSATREPSKTKGYRYYAAGYGDGNPNYSTGPWTYDIGEPASIYHVNFILHANEPNTASFSTARGATIDYHKGIWGGPYVTNISGWDRIVAGTYYAGTDYYLDNDKGHNRYTINWNCPAAANYSMTVNLNYYTYTLTPSEYNFDIYTNPSTGKKGIRVNWNMINEPNYIEYQVHNVTTNQYSPWIVGDKTSYNWTDYNVVSGVQYAYEIIIRQQITPETSSYYPSSPAVYTPSKTITIGVYKLDLNAPSTSNFASANALRVIKGVPFIRLIYGSASNGRFENSEKTILVKTVNNEYSIIEGTINTPSTGEKTGLGYYVLDTGLTKILFEVLNPPNLSDTATVTFE